MGIGRAFACIASGRLETWSFGTYHLNTKLPIFTDVCDEPRGGIKGGIDRGLDCFRAECEDIQGWID